MPDADLLDGLEKLLEKIAVAIHVSGEGSVDLQEFVRRWGSAAQLLWHASQLDQAEASSDDDASARIGSWSLLRRVSPENEDRWLVDFFHRSMKEYFVAKALRRALDSPDAFAATRELLLRAPVQPEILGYVISLTPDASAHRFLCLTEDCELGRISIQADGSLKLSVIQLPRTLRRPENVYLLREDLVLVTAHSEFLMASISEGTATEVAYFRVSSDIRDAAVVTQGLLGLIFEPEYAGSE